MWSKCLSPATMSLQVCMLVSQSCAALYKSAQTAAFQELSTGQSLTMEHLCYLFFLIDNMPVFECLNGYNTNHGQSLLNVNIFQNIWQHFLVFLAVPQHDPKTKVQTHL